MNTILPIVTTVLALSAAPQSKPADAPIRVLLVTGVDHPAHLWKETSPTLRAVLEKDMRLEVRIVEDHEFLASDAVFDYNVVFLHFKDYQPIARATPIHENLAKFVKQGKGLVAFHFASGAFEDWPEFSELAGRVWDRKTAHDPRGPFTVRITDAAHPITGPGGLKDFQADDELYTCLIGERPVKILAVARSKVTGKDHPMAMAFDYGKGRVFNTPLGHDVRAIQIPEVAELTRRGCVWAAGREP